MSKQKMMLFIGTFFLGMSIHAAHWLLPAAGLSGLWYSIKQKASDNRDLELLAKYPSITEYSLSKEDQKNLRPGLKVCKYSPSTGEEYKNPSQLLCVVDCSSKQKAGQKIEVVDHVCDYLDAIDDLHKARWDFFRHLQRPYLLAFKKYGAHFLKNFGNSDQQVDDFIVPNPYKKYEIAMNEYSDKYEAVCKTEENFKKSVFREAHISGPLKMRQTRPVGFIEPTGDFYTDRQRFKDMIAATKRGLFSGNKRQFKT